MPSFGWMVPRTYCLAVLMSLLYFFNDWATSVSIPGILTSSVGVCYLLAAIFMFTFEVNTVESLLNVNSTD